MTNLSWITSSAASALHAAAALAEGRKLVDVRLAAALADPVARLLQALRDGALPPVDFFRHAIPLTCRADSLDLSKLTLEAVHRATGREPAGSELDAVVAALAEVLAAQNEAIPDMARQLAVRGAPLIEQWEARGQGLLAQIGRSTDRGLIPAEVDVALVYPALGGGGAANLSYNLVRVEAVLANPCPAIPEVVRMGWLIAQSKFEPPPSGLHWTSAQLERLAAVALAPAALAAAEYVELGRFDTATLQLAIDVWSLADTLRPEPVELLYAWWNERRDWNLSLLLLDAILREPLC